jgi:hypothetical protein
MGINQMDFIILEKSEVIVNLDSSDIGGKPLLNCASIAPAYL